ncbi:hypothetical protein EVAR_85100_1 [Eumeta japonica]|uniref:Uncharacterized protein n=1 Tax=Eumeta variegata TaxID=151549 RepID=A0A4C1XTF9_EUMVA|nr:hypothetical protein EVAR_85100_1 [Eumeta japonica]
MKRTSNMLGYDRSGQVRLDGTVKMTPGVLSSRPMHDSGIEELHIWTAHFPSLSNPLTFRPHASGSVIDANRGTARFIDLKRNGSKFKTGALVISNSVFPPIIGAGAGCAVSFRRAGRARVRPSRARVSRAAVGAMTILTIMSFGLTRACHFGRRTFGLACNLVLERFWVFDCARVQRHPNYGNIWDGFAFVLIHS